MNWLKHAFAVDPEGPADPTPTQQPVVDWVCLQIARRHLTTPSLVFLEMFRPMNYIGSQTLHFLRPSIWALASQRSYDDYVQFSKFLEHRGSMDYLARRVEYFENEFTRLENSGEAVGPFIQQHLDQVRDSASDFEQQHPEVTTSADND